MEIPSIGFQTVVVGSKLKGVTCQHCGQQYAYVLVRSGVGEGRSALGLDDDRAHTSAERTAGESLKRKMRFDEDVVPCPRCHRIQPSMEAAICQARRRELLRVFGWQSVGLLSLLIGAIVFVAHEIEWGIGFFCLGAGVLAKGCHQWYQARMLNPGLVARGSSGESVHQRVWPRESLETLAAEDSRVDISDALLDWEGQRLDRDKAPGR
jgi:hypothetical protein